MGVEAMIPIPLKLFLTLFCLGAFGCTIAAALLDDHESIFFYVGIRMMALSWICGVSLMLYYVGRKGGW